MPDPALWIALTAAVLSCYFAACTMSLRTFSKARMAELLAGRNLENRLDQFIDRAPKLQLICSTLRTLMNLALFVAVLIWFEELRDASVLWYYAASLGLALLLTIVFSVAIASSIARYRPERLLARSIVLLNALHLLLWPIARLLLLLELFVRRLLGAGEDEESDSPLADEILAVVDEHEEDGAVEKGQKQMLEGVIELPTTTVDEIMTPRTEMVGIEVDAPLDQVRATILDHGHSRIPVYEENLDNIVGVLYAKDLIRFLGNGQQMSLRDVTREPMLVPESKAVPDMLAEFKAAKVHMAIVLDEYGGTAGLVTVEDIIEEIIGDIADEYEQAHDEPTVHRIDEMTADVDGRVDIEDLNDQLDLTLPEDGDYETVGGFVFASLGHIPVAGEQFESHGARFTVTGAQRTKVARVRIELLTAPAANGKNGRNGGDGN